jgi:transcriptional regulator with XRE-family HTH domain
MNQEQLKAMANRIKKRRELLGYTQEQFAEIIELSASSYTKIENAFQKPALNTLVKIAVKLKVSLDYLVFDDEQEQPADQDIATAILDYADTNALIHAKEVLSKIIRAKTK